MGASLGLTFGKRNRVCDLKFDYKYLRVNNTLWVI